MYLQKSARGFHSDPMTMDEKQGWQGKAVFGVGGGITAAALGHTYLHNRKVEAAARLASKGGIGKKILGGLGVLGATGLAGGAVHMLGNRGAAHVAQGISGMEKARKAENVVEAAANTKMQAGLAPAFGATGAKLQEITDVIRTTPGTMKKTEGAKAVQAAKDEQKITTPATKKFDFKETLDKINNTIADTYTGMIPKSDIPAQAADTYTKTKITELGGKPVSAPVVFSNKLEEAKKELHNGLAAVNSPVPVAPPKVDLPNNPVTQYKKYTKPRRLSAAVYNVMVDKPKVISDLFKVGESRDADTKATEKLVQALHNYNSSGIPQKLQGHKFPFHNKAVERLRSARDNYSGFEFSPSVIPKGDDYIKLVNGGRAPKGFNPRVAPSDKRMGRRKSYEDI